MTSKTPSYITKNRLGIYYFQYCVPSFLLKSNKKSIKKVFRKSLHTRNRSTALKQSRILWLIMDKLKLRFFHDHFAFGKAMELLMHYEKYEYSTWEEAEENFLMELEDFDEDLLDVALQYRAELNRLDKVKNDEIEFLKERLAFYQNKEESKNKFPIFELSSEENPILLSLVHKWLEFKKPSLKISSFESIKKSILIFAHLVSEICEHEPTISEITEITCRKYKQFLEKLPCHRNAKALDKKTLIELCALDLAPIAHKTFKSYLVVAVEFLKWSEKEGYSVNPKLSGILAQVRKGGTTESIYVKPFSDEDVASIFNSNDYLQGKFKRASDYWVPLISLYTGARLGEICQLFVSDIYEVEGIWVIDINDNEEKTLKTLKSSKRIVPIHNDLIKLKILDYHEYLQNIKSKNFFNEVRDKRGMYSQFTKRFGNRLKTLGVIKTIKNKERKSFHSFRHTLRTKLVDVTSTEESTIDSIIGHSSSGRSMGEKHYTHSDRIAHKNKLLNKLKYHINLMNIKNWQNCTFTKIT